MDQSDDMAIAQPLGINVRVSNSSLWSKKKGQNAVTTL